MFFFGLPKFWEQMNTDMRIPNKDPKIEMKSRMESRFGPNVCPVYFSKVYLAKIKAVIMCHVK